MPVVCGCAASAVVQLGEYMYESGCGDCCAVLSAVGTISVYKVATYLTRLETRTKESNMFASEWVMLNPDAQ